ncbi:hypothetical protein SDRG_11446, partial [Saprolegnia diclina VS20]
MPRPSMREKTRSGLGAHIAALSEHDTAAIFGDSLTERLQWQHPHLAPPLTWLCGVGGDRISQLAWRVANEEGSGYTQASLAPARLQQIAVLIGSNDLGPGDGASPREQKKLRSMVQHVAAIVAALRDRWPDAHLHVLPIPPIPTRGQHERSPAFRAAYLAMLREQGLLTTEVDWPLMDLENDFEDGVHLSASGYHVLLSLLASLSIPVPST